MLRLVSCASSRALSDEVHGSPDAANKANIPAPLNRRAATVSQKPCNISSIVVTATARILPV